MTFGKKSNNVKFLSNYYAQLQKLRKFFLESMANNEIHFILQNIWSMLESEKQQYEVTVLFSFDKCAIIV